MAQIPYGHPAEREPVRSAEGLQPVDRRSSIFLDMPGCGFRRFEGLEDDILRVLEPAALEPLIDENFNFRFRDLNCHRRPRTSISRFRNLPHRNMFPRGKLQALPTVPHAAEGPDLYYIDFTITFQWPPITADLSESASPRTGLYGL